MLFFFKYAEFYPYTKFQVADFCRSSLKNNKTLKPFSLPKTLKSVLKGVFAKNERGYRLNAIEKRF